MDTREKIIDLAKAAGIAAGLRRRGERVILVAGYFDVLTADHVRRFRELADGRPLMAAVLDPPEALLGAQARAELAAGLSMIDYVFLLDGPISSARWKRFSRTKWSAKRPPTGSAHGL